MSYDVRHVKICERQADLASVESGATLPGPLTSHMAWYFAPNATMAMLPVIEYCTFRRNWRLDLKDCVSLHPVLRRAFSTLPNHGQFSGTIRIVTLLDRLTGRLNPELLSEPYEHEADRITIVDAAQAFGLLTAPEVLLLRKRIGEGLVVVGCTQKWIGSPLPLGFAMMSPEILEADSGLADYLSRRDYLGRSVEPRHGYVEFPDTYSSPLAPVFARYLRMTCGLFDEEFVRMQASVGRNRDKLSGWIRESATLSLLQEGPDARGMVAAYAASKIARSISVKLCARGFNHTIYEDLPATGKTTLRLSAPCIEMDADSESELECILKREP